MNIHAKPGSKIVFTCNGGYDGEIVRAKQIFIIGNVYEVERVSIGGFSSSVKIVGIEGNYNTCLFDDYVEPAAPAKPDQDQMTLRDQFAMAAMQEFMRNSFVMEDFAPKVVAELSFKMADSMLKAREPK